MKLFYQPHPNIKPIVKDTLDYKEYVYHGRKKRSSKYAANTNGQFAVYRNIRAN